jgi:hypothetical protein
MLEHAASPSRNEISVEDYLFLTAQRADKLLRELLFDRVFALRMRGFARVLGVPNSICIFLFLSI